jgi:hypothetical protein
MRVKTLGIVIAVGAVIAVVTWVVRTPDRAEPSTDSASAPRPMDYERPAPAATRGAANDSTPDLRPTEAPARASTTTPRRTAGNVAVPPPGTPVKQLLAELKSAAEQGDAAAGCRLGAELAACRDARRHKEMVGTAQAAACEGVSDTEIKDAWRYLWNAAEQGSVAAMSKFARDPALSLTDLAVSAEGWDLYRHNAPRLLWQAIQGGDVMALYQSSFSTASGMTAGGTGVIERDPYNALVYGYAALPLLDPRRQAAVTRRNESLASELLPDKVLQAAREGDQLRARYFSAATPTQDTENDGYVDVADCAK